MLCMKFVDNSVQQAPQMKIVQLPIIACCRYLNLLFQNNCSVILMTALFQRISQPPGQDEQNCKHNSVNYHNSSSVLTSRMHPLRPTLQGFIFLHNSVFECSFKGCTFHHVWDNFQIYGAQITGKCICNSKKQKKKRKQTFLTMHHPGQTLSKVLFITPSFPKQREITYSRQAVFFSETYPPSRRGNGGGNYVQFWIFFRDFLRFSNSPISLSLFLLIR